MRESAATIKGVSKLKAVPGGQLGELYQAFIQSSGLALQAPPGAYRKFYASVQKLRLFYECDIRCVGRRKYALVGMWTDKGYVDFVARNWRGVSV